MNISIDQIKSGRGRKKTIFIRKLISINLWLSLLLLAPQLSRAGTALGDLAASMSPGTFAQLTAIGGDPSYWVTVTGSGSPVSSYANKAVWDPIHKIFYFLGAPHYDPWKFCIYTDSTNTWTTGPLPIQSDAVGHGYEHNAIDPATGNVYHKPYNYRNIFKYSYGGNSWILVTSFPETWSNRITGGLTYFPEMSALIWTQGSSNGTHGNGGVYKYVPATNRWAAIATNLNFGEYHSHAEYDPINKVIVFGAGNGNERKWYKLNSSGKITALQDSLVNAGINRTNFTVDPIRGKFILTTSDQDMYELDATGSGTWTKLGISTPIVFVKDHWNNRAVVAPVSTYGVVMYATHRYGIYLYRHSPQP